MASARFITKAQAAYSRTIADRDGFQRMIDRTDAGIYPPVMYSTPERYREVLVEIRDNCAAEAAVIYAWLQLALAGESNRDCEHLSGWTPARRDVGRSTAAMVQEVRA